MKKHRPKMRSSGTKKKLKSPVKKKKLIVELKPQSERGKQKRKYAQEAKARIVLDSLILQYPDRAYRARNEDRLLDWLVAATTETIEGNLDREWLTDLAKRQIEAGIQTKYLHATARERIIAQIRENTLARSGFGEFGRAS